MIIKSYEIKKSFIKLLKNNFLLLYGENVGLKKDITDFLKKKIRLEESNTETLSLFENDILNDDENFYNHIYSGSLFNNKKIIIINEATDKIMKKINDISDKFPENTFLIILSGILEKKSKLRNFFEKDKKAVCIPCYSDSEKDLELIALNQLKKNNILISRESINLLIEKSNADRDNLRSEIEKIISYALDKKKIDYEEVKQLVNFSGDYKSDILVNECLCGNVPEYKKIISDLYINTANQVLLLRILGNKVQRLLKIKEQEKSANNIDNLINFLKPAIFWKEKPIVKKQLLLWNLNDLKKIIKKINNIELLCKKNPQVSKAIFFNFFLEICCKANSYS